MSLPIIAQYRHQFVMALAKTTDRSESDIGALVKEAEPQHGDFSFPCFSLAKELKKAPPAIAAGIASQLSVPGLDIECVGPYVNGRIRALPFTQQVIDSARSQKGKYGGSTAGVGKTVAIDYSSPNIAKPIGFHHIRTTIIGHALANLYRAQGWRVEGINYLGDWGKQFGLVAIGFQEYGDPAKKDSMAHLVEVYVKANARAEKEPSFDDKARDFFRRMEAGEPEAIALWKQFRETSVREFRKIYDRLGISFEHYDGESLYQGKMDATIDEIHRTIGTKESQGALIVDLPYAEKEPPVILKKSDGATLYATRDLTAAADRYERFKFDLSLYVVARDQSLHFKQFFNVLEKMGKPWAKKLIHVEFGRVMGMSTRKGTMHLLNDVLDEAKNRALEKVQENIAAGRIHTDNPEELAEQIGLAGIVFGDLKNRRGTDYEFNWEEILNFEGHSGPYLQYAHARACSILTKGGGAPVSYNAELLALPEEQTLVRRVAKFPLTVDDAIAANEPFMVSRYLLELAADFSRWYTLGNQEREKRVLIEDNIPLRDARLALTDAVRLTLHNGLHLLGIATPERM